MVKTLSTQFPFVFVAQEFHVEMMKTAIAGVRKYVWQVDDLDRHDS